MFSLSLPATQSTKRAPTSSKSRLIGLLVLALGVVAVCFAMSSTPSSSIFSDANKPVSEFTATQGQRRAYGTARTYYDIDAARSLGEGEYTHVDGK
jgi:hypothetical protein